MVGPGRGENAPAQISGVDSRRRDDGDVITR
jgi:hypothetical protein